MESLVKATPQTISSEGGSFTTFVGDTLELFVKYLGWVSLPVFVFLVPVGAFLIFKHRTFEKYTIIVSTAMMSLAALSAYAVPAFDTRYLYFLYPMFCVLSVLTVHRFLGSRQHQNLLILLLIIAIFAASMLFFDYLKVDYELEYELYTVAEHVAQSASGVNDYSGSGYLILYQPPETLPVSSSDPVLPMPVLSPAGFSSLDEFLSSPDAESISHLVVDEYAEPPFLYDIYANESDYGFLEKEFDSADEGLTYDAKVFRINYEAYRAG